MKDMPLFTTEYGVASLTLSQIPYTKQAYIRIQATAEPERLLTECIDFCKAAGAEHIFATGHSVCEKYPEHTKLLRMQADRSSIGETDARVCYLKALVLSRLGKYNEALKCFERSVKYDPYMVHRANLDPEMYRIISK